MVTSRRSFIVGAAGLASTLFLSTQTFADQGLISESDPSAQALGYKSDATKVDKAKYANYASGQQCSNCQFYQGSAADADAPCPLVGGKRVAGKGWCSGYAKKG